MMTREISPELLLRAYAMGLFPMAASRAAPEIHWLDPERRGILPLAGFHRSHSLARSIRRGGFEVSIDTDFEAVIDACADREETWINPEIHHLYLELFRIGHAHSLEIHAEGALVGGVYGVTLGAGFFGESMFSRRRDASKLALAYLVEHLRRGGFMLFDVQFLTDHLRSLGAIEISRSAYHSQLRAALAHAARFAAQPPELGLAGS